MVIECNLIRHFFSHLSSIPTSPFLARTTQPVQSLSSCSPPSLSWTYTRIEIERAGLQNQTPCPKPLRAQRSGEQTSRTQRFTSRHLLGCAGNQVFRERLLLASLDWRHQLHPGDCSDWPLPLLPGGHLLLRIVFVFFLVIRGIVFFLVDVCGTALWTFTYIDCGLLLQVTHYVD